MNLMHTHTPLPAVSQKVSVCTLKHGVFKAIKDATKMGRKLIQFKRRYFPHL